MEKTLTFKHKTLGMISAIDVEWTGEMTINGKPVAGFDYIVAYGLRQSLTDSYANATSISKAESKFDKRLNGILTNTVRVRTVTFLDAVEKEIRRIAVAAVESALAARQLSAGKFDKENGKGAFKALVAKYVTAHLADLTTEAEERVNRANESAANVNALLGDLESDGDDDSEEEEEESEE